MEAVVLSSSYTPCALYTLHRAGCRAGLTLRHGVYSPHSKVSKHLVSVAAVGPCPMIVFIQQQRAISTCAHSALVCTDSRATKQNKSYSPAF
jgi:hypothetical protein